MAKFITVPVMVLSLLVSGFGFSINKADAALFAVGPVNPDNGFPIWYQDTTGLKLELCLDQNGMCLTEEPNPAAPISFPDNFGPEMFWWMAEADFNNGTQDGLLVLALEAAFANENPVDGDQISFGRVRIRINGLTPGETYTVVHPFGEESIVADGAGGINTTEDIGIAGAQFVGALGSSVGPFLTWPDFANNASLRVTDANGVVRQYVGNPAIASAVVGSPTGNNLFSVSGPGINESTNLFAVSGKVFAPTVTVNPRTTTNTSPTISGTINDPTATIQVTVGGNTVAATNNGDGTWTVPAGTVTLTNGTFDVQVEATDPDTLNVGNDVSTNELTIKASNQIFRFWSDLHQHHFFTISAAEKDQVVATFADNVWRLEGVGFQGFTEQSAGLLPVYRFWSDQKQVHFYTISEAEKDNVVATFADDVWRLEGVAYYAYSTPQADNASMPLYRFWSDTMQGHFFTTSAEERDQILATFPDNVWRLEGTAFHIPTN